MTDRSAEFAVETSTFARLVSFNPYQWSAIFSTPASYAGIQPSWSRPECRTLSQLINFNQTYPRPTTVALKNSGIASGRDCYDDGRFQVVRRRQAGRLNRRLLCVFPIIVSLDRACGIVQVESWIGQNT